LVRIDVVLDGQLPGRDDALGLVADIEQTLVSIDLDDGALDYVAVVEVLDGLVDRGEECLLRPDVVDRYLGGRGGLRAARHVVVGSGYGQDMNVGAPGTYAVNARDLPGRVLAAARPGGHTVR